MPKSKGGRGIRSADPSVGIGVSIPTSLKALLEDYAREAGIPRSTAIVLAVEMALPSMLAELKNK